MDYESKYKEALERARKLATDLPNGRNDRLYHVWDLETIFPELVESNDERIRKAITEIVHFTLFLEEDYNVSKEDILAWLEKQGSSVLSNSSNIGKDEQKPNETSIAINNPEAYRIGFADGKAHAEEEMAIAWLEKQGEQKHSDNSIDAFIDKAWDYISRHQLEYNDYDDFKSHMKGE